MASITFAPTRRRAARSMSPGLVMHRNVQSGLECSYGSSVPVWLQSNVKGRDECPDAGTMEKKSRQRIRYLNTKDGVKLAWAEAGEGPTVVKAANWFTHLELEWESPVWQHWLRFFAGNFRFVRYDERGCGMTEWNASELSFDEWVEDLEAVVNAADLKEPFTLLGVSQGASVCVA